MKDVSTSLSFLTRTCTKNTLSGSDIRHGRCFAVNFILRGKISTNESGKQIFYLQDENLSSFVEWISDNVKTVACDASCMRLTRDETFLANSIAVREIFHLLAHI